jgi:hypothetical protein
MLKGFVKKNLIKFGQYDYVEICEDGCLLSSLDNSKEFPMLKYIKNSENPRIEIIKQLVFPEL